MHLRRCLSIGIISFCLSLSAWIAVPDAAFAQGTPTISTVTLQVVPGQNGGEQVITPKGMVVPLPGAGVNANSVQIYMGSQGGFWYVDRNGQNVDLTSYVERYRTMTGGQSAQVPQYAAAPQQPVNIYNNQPSSSSGSSALGTAAAAGVGAMGGAMLGSAMSGAYYNNGYYNHVPYGTPMYYPHGGSPYYVNAGGNTVNVNHSYEGASNNTAANVNREQINNQHAENFQKQQEWYQNQQKQNPQQFKAWQQSANGENPFVNKEAQGRFAQGAQQAEGERKGLFGRRGGEAGGGALQGEGGRFGGGAAAESGGGRFGGRLGGGEAGGGRFGRRGNR